MQWIDEIYQENRRFGLRGNLLFETRSPFQLIQIVETEELGRGLLLDGMWMTVEGDEKVYHEMLTHPALVTAPSIRRVLIVGGGDGGTVREVLRHKEVEQVVLAEIDGDVVQASQEYLPTIGTAWNDPRLSVQICDGAAFVMDASPESWDVILVDGSDPVGPAKVLYEERFFAACARALGKEGVLCVQGGSPTAQDDEHISTIRTMQKHFTSVSPLYAPIGIYPGGAWSFIWGTSGSASLQQPLLSRIEAVTEHTFWFNHDILLGATGMPNHVRLALQKQDAS